MATIVLLGIHCSTFLLGILNEYGKVACVKHQQDLFDCEWSFTHELKIQSSSLRLMLSWVSQSLFFDHLRACCGTVSQIWEGIHVQLVRRSVAELSLRVERVSMSNVTRLFAFAVLMIALHRGFFGRSSMSSTRNPLDEDIPVWGSNLIPLTVSAIRKTPRQGIEYLLLLMVRT